MTNHVLALVDEWMHVPTLKLRAGEMTAQETRTVLAVLGGLRAALATAPADGAPVWAGAAWWLRNNYQHYVTIADLCEAMTAASPVAPQPAASEREGEWISVAERLPKESDGTVAVILDGGAVVTAWATYWHGASREFAQWTFPHPDDDGCVVTHWKPLPAIPALDAQRLGRDKGKAS